MYKALLTEQFLRATKGADTESLREALGEIVADPERARGSHPLKNEWSGFRGADYTKRDRIVFRVCEECVRKHQEALHPLACCSDPEGDKQVVTFVDFGDCHISAGRSRLTPARAYVVAKQTEEGDGGDRKTGGAEEPGTNSS